MKKTNIFLAKAIVLGTIVSLTNQEGYYKRIRIIRQGFVNYHVFDILVVKFENVKSTTILFLSVSLSFLVCINTNSKVQTIVTLFKIVLNVELFSCFDRRPITHARKKILAIKMNK